MISTGTLKTILFSVDDAELDDRVLEQEEVLKIGSSDIFSV